MLGVIRKETTLKAMITNPNGAPKVVHNIRKFKLTLSTTPEELAKNISEN